MAVEAPEAADAQLTPADSSGWVADERLRRGAYAVTSVLVFYAVVQRLWPAPAGVLAQGVLVGAMGSLLAIGLALVYRANRVVNFAQADLGSAPVLAVYLLIAFKDWPYWLAVIVGLGSSVIVGALVQRVFIQRFARAPRLILTVVTIGVSQVLIAVATLLPRLIFGGDNQATFAGGLPAPIDLSFTIDPIVFRGNDVLAVVVVPVVLLGLLAFLRFTSVGIAIRASAENAERARLLGVPVARVQTLVWVVASLLSFTAVFLRAGSLGIGGFSAPVTGAATLTRALAVAVIGRMERFGTILVASIAIGVMEQSILWHTGRALYAVVADFAVLMVALLFHHRGARGRVDDGEVSTWKAVAMIRPIPAELADLPEVRRATWVLRAVLLGAALLAPLVLSTGNVSLVALVLVYALLGLSLVVLTGWAGQVSLGQAALFGVGGAVGGALTLWKGWDIGGSMLVAGLVGGVAAAAIGVPALRIKGPYLAVSTLGFSVFASAYLINKDVIHWVPSTGDFIPRTHLLRIDVSGERAFYYLCLGCFLVGTWMVQGMRRSRTGRALIAQRDNERAAQSYGINVMRAKLTAFAMAGFLAAVAGVLYVQSQQALGTTRFTPAESLRVFTMVVIGGMGSISGALIGSLYMNGTQWFVNFLPTPSAVNQAILFLGTGVGVILILLILPGGVGSLVYSLRDRLLRRLANSRGIEVPSLVADRAAPIARDGGTASAASPERARRRVPMTRRRGGAAKAAQDESVLLEVRDMEVGYDGVQVLFGIDLAVRRGEIVALLGTNGAGKSTVLRAVSGLNPLLTGSVTFDGLDLTGVETHRHVDAGVAHVPGGRGVFPSLTVAENLRIGGWPLRKDPTALRAATDEVVGRFPVLLEKWHIEAGNLSGGQQQMLTLAQAFLTRPKLMMIDELSLGLAPVVIEELIAAVKRMRDEGTTVIVVEQSVNVALTVADRAYFLEKGEVRFEGPTADLLDRPDVLRSVFIEGASARRGDGAALAPARERRQIDHGRAALEVVGLAKHFGGVAAVDGVSFHLRDGEILGIIGPNGAGKTTVFDLISGFTRPDTGRVLLHEDDISEATPDGRAVLGLGRSFQDARLFPSLTVADAIAVALERRVGSRDPLAAAFHLPEIAESEDAIGREVDGLIELLGLQAFRDKFVGELSTGSRRIVDLACVLAHRPKVLLFDEPSSGIAQRETEALGPLIRRIQSETGASILVIEHDMPLISSVADRLIAMESGKIIVTGTPAEVLRDPRVVASYLGTSASIIQRSGRTHGPRRGSAPSAAEIRAWARASGYGISDRGRVPAEIVAAYEDALA